MQKIQILHVFPDDKFFDSVSDFFDTLNGVENLYYYYTPVKNYSFCYIKNFEKIKIFNSNIEYIKSFSDPHIDIIYFHSLHPSNYSLLKNIDRNKKVIWWCWGADIYGHFRLLPPLINIQLYKPVTLKYFKKKHKSLYSFVKYPYWLLCYYYDKYHRRKVLERVDYFSPVLPIEYHLMKKNEGFRANPFMLKRGPGIPEEIEFNPRTIPQNILIGNSLTYTNNHLDIFKKIRSYKLSQQKYVLPISYGADYDKLEFKKIAHLPEESTIWIDNFMPKEQYKNLYSTISHAIFGHLRQQAMGNVFMCFSRGIKVFLYSDSIAYKSLKNDGYIIFSIDHDMSPIALQTVLSNEDALINYRLLEERNYDLIHRTERELRQIIEIEKLDS